MSSTTQAPIRDPGLHSEEARCRKQYMVDLFVVQAKNYDFHDDVYGLYAHRLWVRTMLAIINRFMKGRRRARMLDLACGTGFVTFNVARRYSNIDIDGFDISPDMVAVARQRYECGFKGQPIKFWVGDAELPYGDSQYDIITTSFAFRNFVNKGLATDNVFRALKPGGVFIIQDLTKPECQPLRGLYYFYMKYVLSLFTRLLGTEKSAAAWLLHSVTIMPANAQIKSLLESKGFTNVSARSLSLGIACIIAGYKPEQSK